jgi:hypothetical protein
MNRSPLLLERTCQHVLLQSLSLFERTEVDLNQVENDFQYEEMVGGNEGFSSINPLLPKKGKKKTRG